MLPTLNVRGDHIWVNCLYRRGKGINAGDVISFHHPLMPGERASKRVIATEGGFVLASWPEVSEEAEKLRKTMGVEGVESTRVNGLDGKGAGRSPTMVQVPEGHVWVQGDNVDWSRDSRDYGPLPMALIIGKVEARVRPFGEMKWMDGGFRDSGQGKA